MSVLGVDDFALRRGFVYGTVLVDILTHRPVDLVAERTADVLAEWLAAHPGVEVICRDRSGACAESARVGAPEAIQVADRYHLWANLGEAVERTVLAHRACLVEPLPETTQAQPVDATDNQPDRPDADNPDDADNTAPTAFGPPSRLETRTRERHAAVAELLDKGHSTLPRLVNCWKPRSSATLPVKTNPRVEPGSWTNGPLGSPRGTLSFAELAGGLETAATAEPRPRPRPAHRVRDHADQ